MMARREAIFFSAGLLGFDGACDLFQHAIGHTKTVREDENWIAWLCYSFRHMPPRQLWPAAQEFPHRPQFCESLMKLELLTHLPMQLS